MFDVKERLVGILEKARFEAMETIGSMNNGFGAWYADRLLANGVTFQDQVRDCHWATEQAYKNGRDSAKPKWIPIEDRLPTIYDADDDNCVLAIHKASKKRYYHWRSVVDNPFDFTHWMSVPELPKGE